MRECSGVGLDGRGRDEHDSHCDRHTGQARGSGKKGGLAPGVGSHFARECVFGNLCKHPMCNINGSFRFGITGADGVAGAYAGEGMDHETIVRIPPQMPFCAKCRQRFESDQCPACGKVPSGLVKTLRKTLDRHVLWSVAGLLGVVEAGYTYPPLNGNWIYWVASILFFAPVGAMIAKAAREHRRVRVPPQWLLRLSKLSAALLVGLALVVFLNGWLDRSSGTEIRTKVVGKFISRGRFSTTYHLNVPSWLRTGRKEDLRVSGGFYGRTKNGDSISVQMQEGRFGLSWYSRVAPADSSVPSSGYDGQSRF